MEGYNDGRGYLHGVMRDVDRRIDRRFDDQARHEDARAMAHYGEVEDLG